MFACLLAAGVFSPSLPWSKGPAGNATTNAAAECSNPPYSTHDWIEAHAADLTEFVTGETLWKDRA